MYSRCRRWSSAIGAEDYRKGFNQLVQKGAAAGDKVAGSKMNKFLKNMRKAKGAAKWTLYGLLAEIGFMVPFAAGDYAAGESWKRIIGNAADWGLWSYVGTIRTRRIFSGTS